MITKNDFIMVNWGNFVNKIDWTEQPPKEYFLQAVDTFAAAYDHIKKVAPPQTLVQVPAPGTVVPLKGS